MRKRKDIYLLWTGGWDSTFRMCQLSRMRGVHVHPIYITDTRKRNEWKEKEAIARIWNTLMAKHPKAIFHPVQFISMENGFEIPQKFDDAYRRLAKRFPNLGTQYRMLGAFASQLPGIELGEERYFDKPGTLYSIFNSVGGLQFDENGVGRLPETILDPDVALLFGNYTFPIARYREVDMKEMVMRWNVQDVMQHIWFCQDPIHGKPCGCCVPCRIKMKAHMDFLLLPEAKERYRKYKKIEEERPGLTETYREYIHGGLDKRLKEYEELKPLLKDGGNVEKLKEEIQEQIHYFQEV